MSQARRLELLERNRMSQPKAYDLERLKWIEPRTPDRFRRREPALVEDGTNDAILENIVQLTDEIFNHLAVFEQFPETSSRGAEADSSRRLLVPGTRDSLLRAQLELWQTYRSLRERRDSYVEDQLEAAGLMGGENGLKLHIGAGSHILPGWLNIDAGGSDLSLNLNWGLPLPDACAKFAYCAHVLEHLRFTDQAPPLIADIYRVLANDGTVRFVVPDIRKLLLAYARQDSAFFEKRQQFYPLDDGFLDGGIANLNYILLFCGAAAQTLNFNHKFGYDIHTLSSLLVDAGFREVRECAFQASPHEELLVDHAGENAHVKNLENQHYSLFVEATK